MFLMDLVFERSIHKSTVPFFKTSKNNAAASSHFFTETNGRIKQDQTVSENHTNFEPPAVPVPFLLSREKVKKRSNGGHYFQQP